MPRRSFTLPFVCLALLSLAAAEPKGEKPDKERAPKSPEAKIRVTEKGDVLSYVLNKELTVQPTTGAEKGHKLKMEIGRAEWPHLGSVFYEVIFEPPEGFEKDFPVHSPLKPEKVEPGQKIWFAREGASLESLQLYQIAVYIKPKTPAEYNAVVRNSVKIRESRGQTEIAHDYQCRLIESPKGSGQYPDDPTLLERFVPADQISPDRLTVKAPPPNHDGYGKGLKSSDVYANGVGRDKQKK